MYTYNVGVIGLGRVGLPLALMFANQGLKVIGFDINMDLINQIQNKIMPFNEPGFADILRKVDFYSTSNMNYLNSVQHIIITVGTPLLSHIETDLSQINKVLDEIISRLKPGQNIILRSTVSPNTTEYVRKRIENETSYIVGSDVFLSFCPERIAEGKAYSELKTLPQIIGANDEYSYMKAHELFEVLSEDILKTDYLSAELVKLFNNISRYIQFAVSNQFALISQSLGANVYDIIEMANYKYPRGMIAKPGLTAGTCLRKDFGMINETIPYTDLLLAAWKINEYIPKFLVEISQNNESLFKKNVAILGYTFKSEADDIRDSLVPKLYRYITRQVPNKVVIHEPYLGERIEDFANNISVINVGLEEAIADADVIFIAINHKVFLNLKNIMVNHAKDDQVHIIDIWNTMAMNRVDFLISDLNDKR